MQKVTRLRRVPGSMCKDRKIIKSVRDAHAFLNKQDNNLWTIYDGDLKAGTYAYAGGEWHNVKSLDACVLAHI